MSYHRTTRFGLTFRSKNALGKLLGLSNGSSRNKDLLTEPDLIRRLDAKDAKDAQLKLFHLYREYVLATPEDKSSRTLFLMSRQSLCKQTIEPLLSEAPWLEKL